MSSLAGAHFRSTRCSTSRRATLERLGAPVPGSRRTDRPRGVGWWRPPTRRPASQPWTMLVGCLRRLRPGWVSEWSRPLRGWSSGAGLRLAHRPAHRHRRAPGAMPGSVAAAVPAALVVGSLVIAMAAAAAPATVDRYPHAADRVTVVDVDGRGAVRDAQRTFEVVAWLAERRLVLYVPEIEAATSVVARIVGGAPFDVASVEADTAARSLIAELTGLDESMIRCEIRLRPGRGGAVS